MTGLLRCETAGGVALLTLDDPARRNALSLELARQVSAKLTALADDESVHALVVTGAPPAFSAGADLEELVAADADALRRIYEGFLAIARFPLPTIAAVNGAAVGAGLNVALACDVRIAARGARFESRFSDLALHPGGGHGWMLRQLLGPQGAAAIVLCGASLDGDEAARRGLAWRAVDDGEVVEASLELARGAGRAPRELARRMKATLRSMSEVGRHEDAVEAELVPQVWSKQQPAFGERIEAIRARIARRRTERP